MPAALGSACAALRRHPDRLLPKIVFEAAVALAIVLWGAVLFLTVGAHLLRR